MHSGSEHDKDIHYRVVKLPDFLLFFFFLSIKQPFFRHLTKFFFFLFLESDPPGGESFDDSETDGSIISETDTRATLSVDRKF